MKASRLLPMLFVFLANAALVDMPAFKKLDINKDRLLSKYEFEIFLFDIDITNADKDDDGALDANEYRKFIKKLRAIEGRKS